jgi:hypothetical protein
MLKQHDHIEATRGIIRAGIANGKLDGKNNYNLGGVGGVGKYLKDSRPRWSSSPTCKMKERNG